MDKEGNVIPGTYYGMSPDFPLEMLVTVTFLEHEDKTTLTLHHSGMLGGTDPELALQGWGESLDRLVQVLAS